jgi:methylthioxylose transferase
VQSQVLSGRAQLFTSRKRVVNEAEAVEPGRQQSSRRSAVGATFAVLSVVLGVGLVWGRRIERDRPEIKLGAPPLVGAWHWRPTVAIAPALLLAVGVVLFGSRIIRSISFRATVMISALSAAMFSFALAASDGFSAVLAPVVHDTEYWDNLDVLPSGGRMLRWFAVQDFLKYFSVHLKGHPPGFILLLKGLSAIGLGTPWVAGALTFIGVAMMVIGVLVTLRIVVDEHTARVCAPFLVVAPFSMWLGTSADAFFAGVGAVSVAFVVWAVTEQRRRAAIAASAVAGLGLGGLLFLTYAGATFLLVPAVITVGMWWIPWRDRLQRGAIALCALALVVVVFRAFGFWWFDGLRNTNWFYWNGTAAFRPWRYFLVANLAAMSVAIGPAVIAGVASLRRSRLWLPVGAALVCVSAATASQYTKGEVERIWVLFYPWMVPAVAVLARPRRWLALQATVVVVLQVWLVSKW